MISVIMPVYNEEKYLGDAIDSVKKQTYRDWELIIINDASSDNSLKIAQRYAKEDVRIKIIDLKENGGCCNALNVGIENAKGNFIGWLSSDDEYFDTMLNDCMQVFSYEKSVDAVIGRHRFLYQDTGEEREYRFDETYLEPNAERRVQPYSDLFFFGNAFNACSVIMKRDAVLRTGKFSNLHNYAGDYEFMMRMCAFSKVVCIDKEFVKSRVHSEQVTNEQKNEMDAIMVFKEMLYDVNERTNLLKKAQQKDGRQAICFAIENRIKRYEAMKMENEIQLCKEIFAHYKECDYRFEEAENYCNIIRDAIKNESYDKALELLRSMPESVRNYGDEELIGIFSAYVLLYYGEDKQAKKMLDSIYNVNALNYECNYLLAEYYAKNKMSIEAMQHYVDALKNSTKEDYNFILGQFKKYINMIGD